jgi:hypothetical protein
VSDLTPVGSCHPKAAGPLAAGLSSPAVLNSAPAQQE